LTVAAFNRTTSKVDDFLAGRPKAQVIGAHSIEEAVGLLKSPRRVMLMVKAGEAVDDTIEQLLPHLEAGDIIIDGGNSLFTDTAAVSPTWNRKDCSVGPSSRPESAGAELLSIPRR